MEAAAVPAVDVPNAHRPPSSPRATSPAATARATPPSTRCAASRSTSQQGKLTAVMGPSGSGKSTLMHILAGARPADLRRRSGSPAPKLGELERHRDHEAPARAHRLRLPVLQPAADADRGGERRAAAHDRRREARPGVASRSCSKTVGLARPAHAPARRALGRPAAARRDRARARLAADGRLRRRADRQPRLEDRAARSSSCCATRSTRSARRP